MILKFICHIEENGQIKNRFMNFGNYNDQPPPNGIECELSEAGIHRPNRPGRLDSERGFLI